MFDDVKLLRDLSWVSEADVRRLVVGVDEPLLVRDV
jgi:hypothetical protein